MHRSLAGISLVVLLVLTACVGAAVRTAPVLARGPIGKFVADVARGLLVDAAKGGVTWAIAHYRGPAEQVGQCWYNEARGEGFFVAHHDGAEKIVYVNGRDVYLDLLPRAWQAITSTVNELQADGKYDADTARAYVVPFEKATDWTAPDGDKYVRYQARNGPVTVWYDTATGTESVRVDALRTTWTYVVDAGSQGWLTEDDGTVDDEGGEAATESPSTSPEEPTGEPTTEPTAVESPEESVPPTELVTEGPTESAPVTEPSEDPAGSPSELTR